MRNNHILNRTIAAICLIVLMSLCVSGCGNNNADTKNETQATVSNTATLDEVTVQPTTPVRLSLEEKDHTTVKLDSDIDWESLYYEHLRSLDQTKYSDCALIYLNDDDIPELYIQKTQEQKACLIFINEDGLSIQLAGSIEGTSGIGNSGGFWYLEKQGKILAIDEKTGQIIKERDSESATEKLNETRRTSDLYYFTGNDLESTYSLGRYAVDGKIYDTDAEDDGAYDYYDGEKSIPVYDVFEAIKGYFDVDKAKTPDIVSIDSILERLKDERKNPNIKAGEYYGDIYSLVSTYKEASKTTDSNDETETITYRIPQINLDGEDIKAINQEILDKFLEDANHIELTDDEMIRYLSVDYEVYGQNGVLSLVIDGKGYGGTSSPDSRFIYTIDISSEKRISNICLLNSYGVDCKRVADVFDAQVKTDYDEIKNDPDNWINDPESGFDESTYDYLYNSTIERFSPVGEYNKMFFDDHGNLNILYLYKWVAGSVFYERTMTIKSAEIK